MWKLATSALTRGGLVGLCALLPGPGAMAETARWLPAEGFRAPADCALDPFSSMDAGQIERRLRAGCTWRDRAPGLTPTLRWGRSGNRAELRIGQTLSWGGEPLALRVQMQTAARLAPVELDSRTVLGAGLWWQPQARWAMNVRVGGRVDDDGEVERRAALTTAWQPAADRLLFTRLQIVDKTPRHEIGLRWWLWASRIAVDAVLPADPTESDAAARLTLSWRGFRL